MIYLCGSSSQAASWCWIAGIQPPRGNKDVIVVTHADKARGFRPLVSDSVVLLWGADDGAVAAHAVLRHAQGLAKGRRDASLRQSP